MNDSLERSKIAKEPISVLLPVFNQAAAIEPIAKSWLRELDRLSRPFEFIVIDDGSTDATAEVLQRLAAERAEIRMLRHESLRGVGACLRSGAALAQQPLLFYFACDYPYAPTDLKKLLDVIDTVDIVAGARTDPLPGWLSRLDSVYRLIVRVILGIQLAPRPGWRGWADWRRGRWLRFTFGLRMFDIDCAFKLFRRSVFDGISIQSDSQFVHAEILAKANFLGCLMAEVPIGRLGGNFRGVAQPDPSTVRYAAEARRVFRHPMFLAKGPNSAGGPLPPAPAVPLPTGEDVEKL